MPNMYVAPQGDRKVEFWKEYRGGHSSAVMFVPTHWDDDDIKNELEEWAQLHFHNSEYIRYGWNDEKDFGNRK